ncbi:outer membrane beta-barrel protein [Roseovarius sp. SCSIO 43702]|uniref:outer membrane protein n=1 Tax=Roseovarius sp. SCSIO 43702 TaxID=2823043 RepID=UPI001C7341E0|nr:outer membrane beta-barrel protein [Roseovarius sp. SCSIO 43702]QYX57679.1 outer membrane beta-barrel protein [Roseovarius sp. SCSIO 43702]
MFKSAKLALAALCLFATPAAAELELSFYMGLQGVQDSRASGTLPGGAPVSRNVDWEGKSLENPFYYGGRVTWWMQNDIGFGIEGTHAKAYATGADLAALGLSRFELSDGHNIFTLNVMKRFPDTFANSRFTPYVGAGLGVAIPHVDAQVIGAGNRTYDYEATGLAARGIAGMKYAITEDWSVFGEYQATWSDNDITINADPAVAGQTDGKLNTTLVTHAINIGISYSF